LSWRLTGLALLCFFRKYHSNVLHRLNAISPNACCSISYVSVAVLPNFLAELGVKHVAPSTHPFHNTTEGQTRLHCRSTHSRLNQAAISSSGMWCQEMLPSILHGCYFDTFCILSIQILSRIFLIRPRIYMYTHTYTYTYIRPKRSLVYLMTLCELGYIGHKPIVSNEKWQDDYEWVHTEMFVTSLNILLWYFCG
jgi:hypothetical protein